MNKTGDALPADLTDRYPYYLVAYHLLRSAIRYLNEHSNGRQWIANLHSNSFAPQTPELSLSGQHQRDGQRCI